MNDEWTDSKRAELPFGADALERPHNVLADPIGANFACPRGMNVLLMNK